MAEDCYQAVSTHESVGRRSALVTPRRSRRDEQAQLEELVTVLSQIVSNVVSMFNPAAVFVDTPRMSTPAEFLLSVRREVERLLPDRPERSVELLPTSLAPEEEVVGGAAIAIYGTHLRFIVTGGNVKQS